MSSRTIEMIDPGVIASIPTAAARYEGSLYYATDEEAVYSCVKTGSSTYVWVRVSGSAKKVYSSSSLTGWTGEDGNGTATIDGGFKLALTSGSAANVYPTSGQNPRYYRDISADIAGVEDFTIWAKIASATLASDQLLGLSLGDSSDTTGEGACALTGVAGQLTVVPFLNAEYVGAPAGVITFDGFGYLGISRRGGNWAGLGGIGTATTPPTQYSSCRIGVGGSTGQDLPTRLSLYITKYGGGSMDGVFDNVIIKKFA